MKTYNSLLFGPRCTVKRLNTILKYLSNVAEIAGLLFYLLKRVQSDITELN